MWILVPLLQPLHFVPEALANETDRRFHWFGPSRSLHRLSVLTQQMSAEKTRLFIEQLAANKEGGPDAFVETQ